MSDKEWIERLLLNALGRFPGSTAFELWTALAGLVETKADRRLLREGLKEQDHSVRLCLARLEKAGQVTHVIRDGTVLKAWSLA
ncbi:hypothetical protein [Methylomonas sp. HYX-M1]|uniref:hypothetical protein n=1 Tax=Methylomonas sp. HYX-M1 TaxID=3139307 RepID=UPI00345BD8EC